MQQGFFEVVEGGEFLAVDGFEALRLFTQRIQFRNNAPLLFYFWKWKPLVFEGSHVDIGLGAALPQVLESSF